MTDVRGERDAAHSVVLHLEEATARVGVVLLFIALLTPAITVLTKDALLAWLTATSPCVECLAVYEPGAWISIRWTAGLLIATLLSTPLVAFNIHAFVRPALLPKEAIRFRFGLMCFVTVVVGVSLYTGTTLAPIIFRFAVSSAESASLVQALDAAALARLTLSAMWILSLTVGTVSLTLAAGVVGRLHEGTASSWRWRVHVPITLVIISTTWMATTGVRWPMAIVVFGVLECGLLPFVRRSPTVCEEVMDQMGARRRLMVVDCSCEGALIQPDVAAPRPFLHHRSTALCASLKERESVVERAKDLRVTDVIVAGCTSAPCPDGFRSALQSVGCSLRGLDVRRSEFVRTVTNARAAREQRDVLLHGLIDPWSEAKAASRLDEALTALPSSIRIVDRPLTMGVNEIARPWDANGSSIQTNPLRS